MKGNKYECSTCGAAWHGLTPCPHRRVAFGVAFDVPKRMTDEEARAHLVDALAVERLTSHTIDGVAVEDGPEDLATLAEKLEKATAAGPCERVGAVGGGGFWIHAPADKNGEPGKKRGEVARCFDIAREKERKSGGRIQGMRSWKPEAWGFCDACLVHYHATLARAFVILLERARKLAPRT